MGAGITEVTSFCRLCSGGCGVRMKIDANNRIVHIRGDDEQPMTRGYACYKGLQAEEAHHGPARLRRPLKRMPDGTFAEIGLEQALDEIAEKLRPYHQGDDRDALAVFTGNGVMACASGFAMYKSFMAAFGSKNHFSTLTIDQSAKVVSFERLGGWMAGAHDLEQSEVALLVGANPLISHACPGFLGPDPMRRLKRAKGRGLKLIVIDPRKTETGRYADLLLQPLPGQDAAILGGMIRIVLDEGWGDSDFTNNHATAEGMAALRRAVDPLTEEMVERRADLQPGQVRAAAAMFARDNHRGAAFTSTGPSMSPFSNLAQHMADVLNVVCGRYRRAGDSYLIPDPMCTLPPEQCTIRSVTTNGPSAEIYGIDGQITLMPTEQLSLRVGASWLHTEFVSFENAVGVNLNAVTGTNLDGQRQDWTGQPLQRAPKYSGNIGVDYNFRTGIGDWLLTANAKFTTKYAPSNGSIYGPLAGPGLENEQRYIQSGYSLFNARIIWTEPQGRFSIEGFVRNLTDKRYWINYTGNARGDYGTYGPPRTFGGIARYRF